MATRRNATKALASLSQLPLVVILGSTGTGKSKLGLQIASRFNGEIISADSMQVYKGLDIITNKVTKTELKECKHHLMDFVDPLKEFNVVSYRDKTMGIIEEMKSRGKLPVIVGGTNYYIEALLWDILIAESEPTNNEDHQPSSDGGIESHVINSNAHQMLQNIDPVMASRIHPNDHRKASRSLEVFRQTGKLHSDLIAEQKGQNGDHLGGALRFKNPLVIWLTCDQDILDTRLNNRVDDMIKRGLVNEISDFHEKYNKERLKSSPENEAYSEGIFQAIGFKEFHNYLVENKLNKSEVELSELLKESVNALKRVTIKYSKKQNKWVRHRFLGRPIGHSPSVYEFSTMTPEKWGETVCEPACTLVKEYLNDKKIEMTPCSRIEHDTEIDKHKRHVCSTCNNRLFIGDDTWKIHCSSKQHKKALHRKRKHADVYVCAAKSNKVANDFSKLEQ